MPSTFTAVWITLFAVLPGAMFAWLFEREAGAGMGIKTSDRVLKFGGFSACIHLLLAPLTYWIYRDFIATGSLSHAQAPLWLWPVAACYVILPAAAGGLLGYGVSQRWPWTRLFVGVGPHATAWDYLFSKAEQTGFVRIRTTSDSWFVGAYSTSLTSGLASYAAGYPHEADLYLAVTFACDENGWPILNENGQPSPTDLGLLIRRDEVAFLQFAGHTKEDPVSNEDTAQNSEALGIIEKGYQSGTMTAAELTQLPASMIAPTVQPTTPPQPPTVVASAVPAQPQPSSTQVTEGQ
jgi:hypothetical protein